MNHDKYMMFSSIKQKHDIKEVCNIMYIVTMNNINTKYFENISFCFFVILNNIIYEKKKKHKTCLSGQF